MNKTASAAALGYASFALALWLSNMVPAGWFAVASAPSALSLATVLGGGAMTLAGIIQCLRGRAFDSLLFLAFAAYWWTRLLQAHMAAAGHVSSAGFLGWYDAVWAFLAFCLWLAARKHDSARMLFTLGVCISLFVLALAHWSGIEPLVILAGYLSLVTAIVGIYTAAAEAVNDAYGHTVLPLGDGTARGPDST